MILGKCENCGSKEFDGCTTRKDVMYLCWKCRKENPSLVDILNPDAISLKKEKEEFERKQLEKEASLQLANEVKSLTIEVRAIGLILEELLDFIKTKF